MHDILQQFLSGLRHTTLFEGITVVFGIVSVWLNKKENILVYPVGLVNTIGYMYLSFKFHLFGEGAVNFYYTIVSIYGWILWAKKDRDNHQLLQISTSNRKQIVQQLVFFAAFYIVIFLCLRYLKHEFAPGALPVPDAFAAATAFTGMWLMAKKKVESWYWWIATNITSIPLYFVKGLVFTSFYYLILLILAFAGLIEWQKRFKQHAAAADRRHRA